MKKNTKRIVISFAALLFLSVPLAAQELNEKQKENIDKISYSYKMVYEMLRDAKKGDRTSQVEVPNWTKFLENDLKEAKTLNIPDDTPVETLYETLTIAELRAKLPELIKEAKEAEYGANKGKYEKVEKVLKLLSGDKHRMYKDDFKDSQLYGANGVRLESPASIKNSSIWCTVSTSGPDYAPRWEVTIYRFSGMKFIRKDSKSGKGRNPPGTAFR